MPPQEIIFKGHTNVIPIHEEKISLSTTILWFYRRLPLLNILKDKAAPKFKGHIDCVAALGRPQPIFLGEWPP